MTIQQRRRGYYNGYDSNEPGNEPKKSKKEISDLQRLGISIFREIKPGQLDDVISQISMHCSDYLKYEQAMKREIHPAINVLELRESRRILCLANLAFNDINKHIYDNIPSLRKPMFVEPDEVRLFGWSNFVKDRAIGFSIKEPEFSHIKDERADVINELLDLTGCEPEDYPPFKRKTPHISLARINENTPDDVLYETMDAIRDNLPAKIAINRFGIYNPSAQGKQINRLY